MLLLKACRLIAIAIVLSGCSASTPPEDADRRHVLVAQVAGANVGDLVNLPDVVGNDWSRAVFLGPYANNNDVRSALGFDFDVAAVSPWTNTEGGTVVVLANDRGVVAWMGIPSRPGARMYRSRRHRCGGRHLHGRGAGRRTLPAQTGPPDLPISDTG